MTPRERYRQWKRYDKYQAAAERRWVTPIHNALLRQIRMFTDFMQDQGLQLALSQIDVIVKPDPIDQVIRRLYNQEGVKYANLRYGEIQAEYGQELTQEKAFGLNSTWLDLIRQFLFNYGARKIVSITDTTKDFITSYIEKAIQEGKSIFEISRGLLGSEINQSRARVIARTETNTALNNANNMAISRSGLLMEDTWLSAHDNRVRHSHRLVNDETVTHGQRFSNGLRYPGDPEGSADEVINCRCTVASRAKRDANGRLIRVPVMQ